MVEVNQISFKVAIDEPHRLGLEVDYQGAFITAVCDELVFLFGNTTAFQTCEQSTNIKFSASYYDGFDWYKLD